MRKIFGFVLVGVMAVMLAGCTGGGKYEGYLFAYFEGGRGGEALRFAVSRDAVNWYALNQDQPIIPSAQEKFLRLKCPVGCVPYQPK